MSALNDVKNFENFTQLVICLSANRPVSLYQYAVLYAVFCCSTNIFVSRRLRGLCQIPSNGQTDTSVVSVGGVHPFGEMERDAS